jgi:hypothetical protein
MADTPSTPTAADLEQLAALMAKFPMFFPDVVDAHVTEAKDKFCASVRKSAEDSARGKRGRAAPVSFLAPQSNVRAVAAG